MKRRSRRRRASSDSVTRTSRMRRELLWRTSLDTASSLHESEARAVRGQSSVQWSGRGRGQMSRCQTARQEGNRIGKLIYDVMISVCKAGVRRLGRWSPACGHTREVYSWHTASGMGSGWRIILNAKAQRSEWCNASSFPHRSNNRLAHPPIRLTKRGRADGAAGYKYSPIPLRARPRKAVLNVLSKGVSSHFGVAVVSTAADALGARPHSLVKAASPRTSSLKRRQLCTRCLAPTRTRTLPPRLRSSSRSLLRRCLRRRRYRRISPRFLTTQQTSTPPFTMWEPSLSRRDCVRCWLICTRTTATRGSN